MNIQDEVMKIRLLVERLRPVELQTASDWVAVAAATEELMRELSDLAILLREEVVKVYDFPQSFTEALTNLIGPPIREDD